MLLSSIISFFAVSAVFAYNFLNEDSSTNSCSEKLEGIVHVPKNCAYNYLKSINQVLKVQSPLFWNNPVQARSAVDSFKATYGVNVVFIDAMGSIYFYPADAASLISIAPKSKGLVNERAFALGEGFSANTLYANGPTPTTPITAYSSKYWSLDGQIYIVSISMNAASVPEFC